MRMMLYSLVLLLSFAYHLFSWDKLNSPEKQLSDLSAIGFDSLKLKLLATGEENQQILHNLPDLKAIAEIKMPLPDSDDQHWSIFADQLIELDQNYNRQIGRNSKITHFSPHIALLAYMAKYQPERVIGLVEQKAVTISAFDHLIQMGLLKNWYELANDPDQLIRASRVGLLRLALNQGVNQSEEIAKKAFLNSDSADNKSLPVSLVNLRFALNSMNDSDKLRIADLLQGNTFNFDINEIRQLRGIFSDETLLSLISNNIDQHRTRQQFWFDAAQMNSQTAVETMLSDYSKHLGDDKKVASYDYKKSAACNICFLALTTDGLMFTHQQAKQLGFRPTKYKISRDDGKLIIEDWLQKEGVSQ